MTAFVPELPEVPVEATDAYDFYGIEALADDIEQELREYGIELDLN